MRIKLRLYTRDLDLIALKYIPGFRLGAMIRTALIEYVETGAVGRILLPTANLDIPLPQYDQINVSITGPSQQKVIDWLMNMKPGFRSIAVKTIVRSAIGNPILDMLSYEGCKILLPFTTKGDTIMSQDEPESPLSHDSTYTSEQENKTTPSASIQTGISKTSSTDTGSTTDDNRGKYNTSDDDELDLFDFDDFDNF